jgi:hypothetical protein
MVRLRWLAVLVFAILLCCAGDAFAQGKVQAPPPKLNQADAEAAAGMAIGFMICMGVSFLIGIALLIWIILFTVKDAKKRGMDPTIWVVLEIFLGLIGFIIYLCVREPLKSGGGRVKRRTRDEDDDRDDDDNDGEEVVKRRR